MSKFYGIGVGPGDPELITVKGAKLLKLIDVLISPTGKKNSRSLAHEISKDYMSSELEVLTRHFPMTHMSNEETNIELDNISKEISSLVAEGKNVGFVTLGDPMTYSTYIYLLRRLQSDIEVVTIPGITSFHGIASGYNYPLVDGESSLVVIPCTKALEDIERLISSNDSAVLMKVYRKYNVIKDMLIRLNLSEKALVVSNYSTENELKLNLEDASIDDISYFTTIVINKNR